MVDTVNELTHLSEKLNKASDRLNAVITDINSKLQKLNLGIEAWYESLSCFLWSGDPQYEGKARSPRSFEAEFLGFARVGDAWQLAVKKAIVRQTWNPQFEDYVEWELIATGSPVPLLKCSREIRAAAVEILPKLLDVLKKKGEAILQAVANAEQLAAQIGKNPGTSTAGGR